MLHIMTTLKKYFKDNYLFYNAFVPYIFLAYVFLDFDSIKKWLRV